MSLGRFARAMSEPAPPTVLHYTGYDDDRGGIMSVVAALAGTNAFPCVVGVNRGYRARRFPRLPTLELPPLGGERLGLATWWRARGVARQVQAWLAADPARVFHGHSRAGLAVALHLHAWGEPRVVATVHCYGRQRWYYRRAARRLGGRLFWLSPAMRRHYGIGSPTGDPWQGCLPGCVPATRAAAAPRGFQPDTALRLAGVGALTPWKRWHLVLAALAALPAACRSTVVFRHVGGPDGSSASQTYAAELQAETVRLGLASVVEWWGEQAGAGPLLADSDALVVASAREPFSVAMLEALFAGVPVLAADSGGASDLVVPPVNGWLFRTDDPADLARAIEGAAAATTRGEARIDRDGLHRFTAAASAARHLEAYRFVPGTTQRAPETRVGRK